MIRTVFPSSFGFFGVQITRFCCTIKRYNFIVEVCDELRLGILIGFTNNANILQDFSSSQAENIVKPPAGFEDSPRSCQRVTDGKAYKKQEKRYRSEERWLLKTYNTRAKSEERLKETRDTR